MSRMSAGPIAAMALTIAAIFVAIGTAVPGFFGNGGDSRFGSVSMPGRAILHLPAGTADITYAVDTPLNNSTPSFNLAVVSAATGKEANIHFKDGSSSTDNGTTLTSVGTVAIRSAGRYGVQVSGIRAVPELDPRLEFGTGNSYATLGLVMYVIAGVVVLVGAVLCLVSLLAAPRGQAAA